jgi:hypothetical protein
LTNNPHSHYSQLVSAQQLDHKSYPGIESEYAELTEEEALDSDNSQPTAKEELSMGDDQHEQKKTPTRTISASTLIQEIGKLVPDTFGMYAWGTLFGIREFPPTKQPKLYLPSISVGGLVYPAHGIVYGESFGSIWHHLSYRDLKTLIARALHAFENTDRHLLRTAGKEAILRF